MTTLNVNLGFTGSNNAVIRPALQSYPPELVLLLNADTFVEPNAFKALVDFMDQNPKIGTPATALRVLMARRSHQRSASNLHWTPSMAT